VLKQFLEDHGLEVVNMLLQGITLEDEMAALRAEAIEEGLEQGKLEVARNLLAQGSTPEFVQKITGLSQAAIERC
jgi:predicted transposase/invertase (TIGR01784 family)